MGTKDFFEILDIIKEVTDDMVSTFDACLVQKLPRKDIISLYMEVMNDQFICSVLKIEWE